MASSICTLGALYGTKGDAVKTQECNGNNIIIVLSHPLSFKHITTNVKLLLNQNDLIYIVNYISLLFFFNTLFWLHRVQHTYWWTAKRFQYCFITWNLVVMKIGEKHKWCTINQPNSYNWKIWTPWAIKFWPNFLCKRKWPC